VIVNVAADDPEAQASVAAFKQAMQQLGWIEGRNLQIDFRGAAGDPERMQAFAKELVALKPYVMTGKWLELLKEIAPRVKRVAFVFNPKLAPGGGSYYTRLIEAAAPSFAVAPIVAPVHGAADIERAIGEFVREPNGGLVVLPDATTLVNRKLIVALADRHRLPAIYAFRVIVSEGGLMSYGIDVVDQYRQAAVYVDRILKGAKPAELPVQLPTKFVMSVNLKTATKLGLDVPLLFQQRADEIVE
jgi:putative ABC transport system substrate-binding protein